jgi:hypothetical protein
MNRNLKTGGHVKGKTKKGKKQQISKIKYKTRNMGKLLKRQITVKIRTKINMCGRKCTKCKIQIKVKEIINMETMHF